MGRMFPAHFFGIGPTIRLNRRGCNSLCLTDHESSFKIDTKIFIMIVKSSDKSPYYFEENCYITELLNESNFPGLSIAHVRVLPGEKTELHRLTGLEAYYILSGYGEVEIDGEMKGTAEPGDVVVISPQSTQRVFNHGQEDLLFLAICSPRFEVKNYTGL